jgi:hypothetical protein
MYLIPSNPKVFNIKWDLCATKYAPPSNPTVPASSTAPAPPSGPQVLYPASSGIKYRRPAPGPCTACNCSPRGISVPPQKRLSGLHRLGDTPANACVYYGADGVTVESVDQNSDPTECAANGGRWEAPPSSTTTSVGLPAGSVLLYTASWKQSGWKSLTVGWNDPAGLLAKIQPTLQAQYGINVLSSTQQSSSIANVSGQNGFSLQLQTLSDRNLPSDVQSIVDGLIFSVAGEMPSPPSTIILTKSVSAPGSVPQASDLTGWLTQNWPLIAAVGIGLVAVKEL